MRVLYIALITLLFTSQLFFAQKSVNLFNHKDLKGWYAFVEESGKSENAEEIFSVEDSVIRMYGKNAGYLMTEQSFKDFKLSVEYRWNTDTTFARKNNKKNSGVMYLVPKSTPDTLWPKGIQFQVKEGATGDFILLQKTTLTVNGNKTEPGRSVKVSRQKEMEKSIGEWNIIEVLVENGVVKQLLNGVLVNEGNDPSVLEGRILLQYEGFPIDFRNVHIIY